MRLGWKGLSGWLAVAIVVAAPGPLPGVGSALAQQAEAQDARMLFQKGQAAYRRGDYDEAIRHWEAAYRADPRPLILYNISQAYERLGQVGKAVETLERYLQEASPDDPNQSDARARLSALRERLQRTGVVIEGAPEGAAIYVDDKLWGRAPRPDPIRLEPGSHQVRVELDGYETFRASIVVPAGQQITVRVEMAERQGGTGPAPAEESGTADGASPTGAAPASSGGGSVLPLVLMIGGGAMAAGGGIVGYLALDKASAAEDPDDPEADQARTLGLVADLLIWPGLALAATGAVLMVLEDDSGAERPTALRAAPLAGPGVVGAAVSGSF